MATRAVKYSHQLLLGRALSSFPDRLILYDHLIELQTFRTDGKSSYPVNFCISYVELCGRYFASWMNNPP
jgi:hypothetical protein